jgi:Sortilin, neurotensin receptor 3,
MPREEEIKTQQERLTAYHPAVAPAGQWVCIGPRHITAPALPNHTPPLGAYHAVGRLTTIAIHPTNPQVIYVGSPGELGREGCGIWKTTDGGQTWRPVGDSLPTLAVAAIALDPTDSDCVYVATAGRGIFRSDDAGQDWDKINLSEDPKVRTNTAEGNRTVLLINPTSPNILYLTTDDGVLRSEDGGQHWLVSLGVGAATNLIMDPLHPTILYAGILGQGVYKTTDGGVSGNVSWQLQNQPPLPSSIPAVRGPLLAISHPVGDSRETVYALYPRNSVFNPDWELYRTTDGTSWTGPLYSCLAGSEGCLFVVIAADPVNKNRVLLGGPLLFISEIGVTPFTRVPSAENDRQPDSPHGDYWALTFDPTNSQIVFACSDGGIYRSTNHGLAGSWSFIGEGITNVEMYALAQAATQPNLLLAGTQDNGNILYTGSPVWDHIPPDQIQGGDGAAVAIDPSNANIFYAMGQFQDSLSQSLNRGQTAFLPFAQGLPPSRRCAVFNSTFHFQVHPARPTTLLASCTSLWRTTTNVAPGNWTSIFTPPAGKGNVVRSAIDGGSDLYYVGTDSGHVFAVPGDGTAPLEILAHPNSQHVSDIEVDPAHPETIYVSFAPPFTVDRQCAATAGQSRIYQLKRLSPVPNLSFSFTDITGNLQSSSLCVNALAIDPHIPRTLYAGTNRGVYRGRSNAKGGPWVWEAYHKGMPRADVRALEVHPVTGTIDAATYGRSGFELVPERALSVGIEIQPGTSEDIINIKSKGTIRVAILSSVTFDAANEVDKHSLRFGRTGAEASLARCNRYARDVNGDGLPDLVCHFNTSLTGFQVGDTVGFLKGLTVEGVPIEGSDEVRILTH